MNLGHLDSVVEQVIGVESDRVYFVFTDRIVVAGHGIDDTDTTSLIVIDECEVTQIPRSQIIMIRVIDRSREEEMMMFAAEHVKTRNLVRMMEV